MTSQNRSRIRFFDNLMVAYIFGHPVYTLYKYELKGKEKERKWTRIAPIVSTSTTKRSDVDHTALPANTPHLT